MKYICSDPPMELLEEEDGEGEAEEAESDGVLLYLNPCKFVTVR